MACSGALLMSPPHPVHIQTSCGECGRHWPEEAARPTDEHIKLKLFSEVGLGGERPFEPSAFTLVKSQRKNILEFLA